MRETEFRDYLQKIERGVQRITAVSYVARARSIENELGRDLDLSWGRSGLRDAYDQVETSKALGHKTKADYKTALNAYDKFCAVSASLKTGET